MISTALSLPGGRFVVPGNRWDLVPETAPARQPDVSVIIPYYQSRPQLDLVLEALRLQDYPAERFEVIVADDGSPDPLILNSGPAGGSRIKVVRQPDQGFRAAAARNLGARVADGELLCFLDQDTVPEPDYLSRLTRLPALLPDALVVGRRRHADLRGWTPARLGAWLSGTGEPPQQFPAPAWLDDAYRGSGNLLDCDERSYRFIISAVMACSAGLFHELGGFDESFTSYGGEDWELAFRAWNAGAVLAHEPRAVAWHDGPDWAGRGDTAERELVKAEELRALARLIPGPERGEEPDAPLDLVVTWAGTAHLDDESLTSGVLDLLRSPINLGIYLDRDDADRPRMLPASVRGRVRVGPVPDDVLTRARHRVSLNGKGDRADSLGAVRDGLEGGAGRVRLQSSPVMGFSQRASRRAHRWNLDFPERDLVADLFGELTAPEPDPASS